MKPYLVLTLTLSVLIREVQGWTGHTLIGCNCPCRTAPNRFFKPLDASQLKDDDRGVFTSFFRSSVIDREDVVNGERSTSATFPTKQLSEGLTSNDVVRPDQEVYQKGLLTIGFITFLFASNSPALHAAYSQVPTTPPVLLLNAVATTIAMVSVVAGGKLMDDQVDPPALDSKKVKANSLLRSVFGSKALATQAGLELGFWKFCGTIANIYGLSETSADHGAFLIQLTTLLVPLAQGIMGVPIPSRIWSAIALALSGVFLFTQDADGQATVTGDLSCALAAVFYATYDLRLFHWGKQVAPLDLITSKIVTQTALAVAALLAFGAVESWDFLSHATVHDLGFVGLVALWSGILVNAVAPYLQVGGQQAVGPARAQILYASQPLWAALMSLVFLGETVGTKGVVGGAAFLVAMMLAATADVPDRHCEKDLCEV